VRKGWYLLEYMASGEHSAVQTQPSESGRGE
jgi:hypothetical protein